MYTVKIFVAGSKQLILERNQFKIVASELQSEYCKMGYNINIQVVTFETFDYFFSNLRKQKAYNEYITKEADVVYFVLDGNIGGITEEEFNIAYMSFYRRQKPLICIFSHINDCCNNDIEIIRNKITEVGQYYTEYTDEKELKSKIEKSLRYVINITTSPKKHINKLLQIIGVIIILFSICIGFVFTMREFTWNSKKLTNISTDNIHQNNTLVECKVNNVVFNMIKVPAGSFIMGGYDDDSKLHQVTISKSFFISETEVTQELWNAIMSENPSMFVGEKFPVNNLSWDECLLFINKLNEITGDKYRLPTEAEWEYVAKFDNENFAYSGSDLPNNVAWYIGNSNNQIHEVKLKKPNSIGVYDMSGNVWEWCFDYYDIYNVNESLNPVGPKRGIKRVRRGGSFQDNAKCCLVTFRSRNTPNTKRSNQGFRLVKEFNNINRK